jgi:hypothetical protein
MCLALFCLSVGLWLVRARVESLSLMHAGDFQCRLLVLPFLQSSCPPFSFWYFIGPYIFRWRLFLSGNRRSSTVPSANGYNGYNGG